ncbi:PhzF family phenazine biosynthesis protein [Massilia sp. TS11]|uniref:PhzF family phenazine biosynthesis protein n=1 Tax=Massilia sp. TS11 TaxID=2908003 RepID=UPI001EDA6DBB|nr:PhzF family phenazine biosynthesis protein [Massilia sp. TS11]MCG2582942.1 PhzF family phenazine biosynthesis protein [Massilia sp. TS11]
MQIHALNCFGAGPGRGNLAYVIEDGPDTAAARQAFAAAQPASACAFVRPLADDAVEVDYVYPHARSPLCLHASLAVAHLLLARQPRLRLRTAMHGQWLEAQRAGDDVLLGLAPQPVTQPPLPDLAALLGAPGLAPVSPAAVASVGSPKLLVELASPAALQALRPDLAAILDWGRSAAVNGIYAWCRQADGSLAGRNFNHRDPAREDLATGVAAGALAVHLGQAVLLYQGGGQCRLRAHAAHGQIWVGGRAEPA